MHDARFGSPTKQAIHEPSRHVCIDALVRMLLAVPGVLLVLVGALFIGQGTNVIHGSSMSGHGGYAGLGGVLLALGLALLIAVWRIRTAARRA